MSSPPKAVDDPETRSDRRWTWGLNGPQMTEKNAYGRFLDDVVAAFAEVSIPGLPALWFLMYQGQPFGITDLKLAALATWVAMVLGVAAFRSGLLPTPGIGYDGWVAARPSLLLFRVPYYSLTIVLGGFLAGAVGTILDQPALAVVATLLVAGGGLAAFPRVTESFEGWLAEWNP